MDGAKISFGLAHNSMTGCQLPSSKKYVTNSKYYVSYAASKLSKDGILFLFLNPVPATPGRPTLLSCCAAGLGLQRLYCC